MSIRVHLIGLAADLRATGPKRLAEVAGATLLVSLLEGTGVVMVVPVLLALAAGQLPEAGPLAVLGGIPLPLLLCGLVLVSVLHGATTLLRHRLATRLRADLVARRQGEIADVLGAMRWPAFQRLRHADALAAMTNHVTRTGIAVDRAMAIGTGLVILSAHALLTLWLCGWAGLAVLGLGGSLWIVGLPLMRRTHRLGGESVKVLSAWHGAAEAYLSGMRAIRVFGAVDRHRALLRSASLQVRAALIAANGHAHKLATIQRVVGVMVMASALALALGPLEMEGAPLITLAAVAARLLPLVRTFSQDLNALLEQLPAHAAARRLMAEARAACPPPVTDPRPLPEWHRVRLHDVTVSLTDSDSGPDAPAIERFRLGPLDLTLPARGLTVVVGPSGAGKSTLVDVLLGLRLPDTGMVEVGGVPLTEAHLAAWHRQTAFVPQDVHLFNDTIRANLLWGMVGDGEDIPEGALRHALAQAHLTATLARFPEGLDTLVGERGGNLSGGERQRLALARALLRLPRLLVLDEATSALDPESEQAVTAALADLRDRMTVFMITHRLDLARGADQICVLDHGRLAEAGTWDDLASRPDGRLARMLNGG